MIAFGRWARLRDDSYLVIRWRGQVGHYRSYVQRWSLEWVVVQVVLALPC